MATGPKSREKINTVRLSRFAAQPCAGIHTGTEKLLSGHIMKFVTDRPFADPEAAARKLLELANAFEPVPDGRIYIEKINGPFLFELKGTPAEYKAGLDCAIARGWLGAARERNLCAVHRYWCRAVRVTNS
jgi:hypothetical protein